MQLLVKYEARSSRVKGLSFHSARPWLLASLHSGSIVLYDYNIGCQLHKFSEHSGPVRSVHFHPTQPLFVSGGDDHSVKVWNYKQKRCLFTLQGHTDYVRTVEFHSTYPWIVSASDDQTIRIWNWQSRTCIALLAGHYHYVMNASFHPKNDLIVSSSLDGTVRVWDISGLRKKKSKPNPFPFQSPLQSEFLQSEGIVKFVLEGHDRGCNWAAFHPTLPLICSASDDRKVKIWKISDNRAWEVDTYSGHFSNVSSCLFHPTEEVMLSNSEDKTIRVWDLKRKQSIQTFRREKDRFWIMARHPSGMLFAAGHDSGLIVFKLERERAVFAAHNKSIFYVKEGILRIFDVETKSDSAILTLAKPKPRSMHYNPNEHSVLLHYGAENPSYEAYELYKLPSIDSSMSTNSTSKRSFGNSVCFVSRNRFAVFFNGSLSIKNFSDQITKAPQIPSSIQCTAIFPAMPNHILLKSADGMHLFNTQSGKVLAEVQATGVKYVHWDEGWGHVALLSKKSIILCDKYLTVMCRCTESIRVKSGSWWGSTGIFIYSTHSHLKYALPNGDKAIIRTIHRPLYIAEVSKDQICAFNRKLDPLRLNIDFTEMTFKLAVIRGDNASVFRIIKRSRLLGQSIIGYLTEKGYPEIALHFMKDRDPRVAFDLAIQCGLLEVAKDAAKQLDREEFWTELAEKALGQSNHAIYEHCLHKTKNVDKLAFFYVVTGRTDELKKLRKIAEIKGDLIRQFTLSLYLGDAESRAKLLQKCGFVKLAHLTAVTNELTEIKEVLETQYPDETKVEGDLPKSTIPAPPVPVSDSRDWPIEVRKSALFERLSGSGDAEEPGTADTRQQTFEDKEAVDTQRESEPEENVGDAWGGDGMGMELDFEGLDTQGNNAVDISGASEAMEGDKERRSEDKEVLVIPVPGKPIERIWNENYGSVGVQVAAGNFELAMKALTKQIGVVNFYPLKEYFISTRMACQATIPFVHPVPHSYTPLVVDTSVDIAQSMPNLPINKEHLKSRFRVAYELTSNAKFQDALLVCKEVIKKIPLFVTNDDSDKEEILELFNYCKEYSVGLMIEAERKRQVELKEAKKAAELAIYFSNCNLKPFHHALTLYLAMSGCMKVKNFEQACTFARTLLDNNPIPQHAKNAKEVIRACAAKTENTIELDFDDTRPYRTCPISMVPVYQNTRSAACPYCNTLYLHEHSGKPCVVCEIAEIGRSATGLRFN